MTWIRFDDTFFTHPKTLDLLDTAGAGGVAFHLAALCWCSHRLTDGRVPDSALHLISSQSHTPTSVVDHLEASGYWERHEDGRSWQLVNYLEWQESRASIEAKRERERDKKAKQRGGKPPSPEVSPEVSPGDSPEDTEGSPAPTEDRGQSSSSAASGPEPDDDFEYFWQQYPKRDGKRVGKAEAHAVWKRMTEAERDKAFCGVHHYAESGWKPKDAVRWLRAKAWEDWQEPAKRDDDRPAEPKKQAVF